MDEKDRKSWLATFQKIANDDAALPAGPAASQTPLDESAGLAFVGDDPVKRVAAFLRIYAARIRRNEHWDVPETMALAYESAAQTLEESRASSPSPSAPQTPRATMDRLTRYVYAPEHGAMTELITKDRTRGYVKASELAALLNDVASRERTLEFCLGQLRHAYVQLQVGAPLCPEGYWTLARRQSFARGLIGPVIVRLEHLSKLASPSSTESP